MVWSVFGGHILGDQSGREAFPCSVALAFRFSEAFPCSVALILRLPDSTKRYKNNGFGGWGSFEASHFIYLCVLPCASALASSAAISQQVCSCTATFITSGQKKGNSRKYLKIIKMMKTKYVRRFSMLFVGFFIVFPPTSCQNTSKMTPK